MPLEEEKKGRFLVHVATEKGHSSATWRSTCGLDAKSVTDALINSSTFHKKNPPQLSQLGRNTFLIWVGFFLGGA